MSPSESKSESSGKIIHKSGISLIFPPPQASDFHRSQWNQNLSIIPLNPGWFIGIPRSILDYYTIIPGLL